jgi:PPOX class probable F420-dependent enzyme
MEPDQKQAVNGRLQQERIIWLATTRANGAPHLVPIWFVWDAERLYFTTGRKSQKMRNIEHTAKVALALPDGLDVVIIEGEARLVDSDQDEAIARLFIQKYDWDYRGAKDAVALSVEPARFLTWNQA